VFIYLFSVVFSDVVLHHLVLTFLLLPFVAEGIREMLRK
jgi:ABC-type phosphate transport system permease subunit